MAETDRRDDAVAALSQVLDGTEAPRRSLVVANRAEPEPVVSLLSRAFEDQPVAVGERDVPEADTDTVLLVEDDEVIATSSFDDVMRCCLLVNSDSYRTGTTGVDQHVAPPTITGLDEVVFDLAGYPASNKQKLLLVVLSRFVERRALAADGGRLRSTFQRLSRLRHESGTRQVYERLRQSDVDVHVYGVGDATVTEGPGFTAHTGDHHGYRTAWCVAFVPDGAEAEPMALIALETGHNEWRGMWTFDPETVRRVDAILETQF